MTIKDCTKQELIYIIKYLSSYGVYNIDIYVERALNDIEYKRELKRLEKADELAKVAHDARMHYCDYLKKYEGVPILDIPQEEIETAHRFIKIAQNADKEYSKIMGIE